MDIFIAGAGDIGFQLAKRLSFEKHNITLIESDANRVASISENLDAFVYHGNATSWNDLKKAGIEKADIVAALTTSDETNLMVCRFAKKLTNASTISRANNPELIDPNFVLKPIDLDADLLVNPDLEAAQAIDRLVRQSNATDILEFDDGKIRLIGIRIDKDSPLAMKSLIEIGSLLRSIPFRIVAIKRNQFTIVPRGSDLIMSGDQIFIISSPENFNSILNAFGKSTTQVKNLLIIGGGKVGKLLAQGLEKEFSIKIIELNPQKAEKLAIELRKCLVINGDASDLDLLTYEGLIDMDEFIAVTGDDETNIITSLVARHLRVPRTITLLRKREYLPLTGTIGLDAVVSKQQLTVNTIQKFIRRKNVASFAELPGVDAEIMEFIAAKGMKCVGKELKNVSFPNNSMVGAILKHEKDVVIPIGSTIIEPDDRVIVFALPQSVKAVEKMF